MKLPMSLEGFHGDQIKSNKLMVKATKPQRCFLMQVLITLILLVKEIRNSGLEEFFYCKTEILWQIISITSCTISLR